MDYPEKRRAYLQNFEHFSELVHLNEKFIHLLENHRTFGFYMTTIQNRSEERKKDFILLELTLTRSKCNEIIRLLDESGQSEAALILKDYNTSPGRMPLSLDICIPVNPSDSPMVGSAPYEMTRNPRGPAIIINNVPDHLFNESKRFEHIFKELMFNVEDYYGLTAVQTVEKLEEVKARLIANSKANKRSIKKTNPQAIIIMIITHGINDKILGYEGCQALEAGTISEDYVDVSKIVNLFSDTNFPFMKTLPKIFFFTCCRNKVDSDDFPPEHIVEEIEEGEKNMDTFICYSCLDGHKSYYTVEVKISDFGLVLSNSFAQYSNHLDLNGIITRTNQHLLDLTKNSTFEQGSYAAEIRTKGLQKLLFFNPKYSDDN